MKIKVIYRRNLKMSEGKLAAQVAHAVVGLRENNPMDIDMNRYDWDKTIVVLKASDNKFREKYYELKENLSPAYMQIDWGLTEVEEGTWTALAYYEE